MREVLLLKCGELVLKGLNRSRFESRLLHILRARLAPLGDYRLSISQSTIYVEPQEDAPVGEALEVCRSIVGRSNPNAASDLGVAALNLLACVRGAWLNVLINLSGVRDENERERFRAEGERIESSAARLADEIYQSVKNSL